MTCAQVRQDVLQTRSTYSSSSKLTVSSVRDLRIAMVLAGNPEILRTYQPFLNLWRCYALRHRMEFIVETDDLDLRAHFRHLNWFRWHAARKYLKYYDYLWVVDPDMFVVPSCWSEDVRALLADGPHVLLRDVAPPQTPNNGAMFLRNSAEGRYFLDLLLEKVDWVNSFQHDQGAFDETVLEVLGTEAAARRGEEVGNKYYSECLPHLLPTVGGHHIVALYSMCWWDQSAHLAGPFGQRTSEIVSFLDPRVLDMNSVVGLRGDNISCFIRHFAGRGKDWAHILENFGLPKAKTGHCDEVFAYVDSQPQCEPGSPPVESIMDHCPPPLVVC